MVVAYIKLYVALGLGNLSILELNDLQREIDDMIRARCDMLLADDNSDRRIAARVFDDSLVERGREISAQMDA